MKTREALARGRQALTNIIRQTTSVDAKRRLRDARRSLNWEGEEVPAVEATDYLDGTSGTRQPNPQSATIEAVLGDGLTQVWRDDALPVATSLTWDGTRGTYHTGQNNTVGVLVCARSRDGAAHDATISVSGFAGLTTQMYSARYITQTLLSFFGSASGLYTENLIAKALRLAVGAMRNWLSRPKANKQAPAILDDVQLTASVPASGTQLFWVDVYVPKGTAAGTITGNVLLNGEIVLPVDIVVRDHELSDDNHKPNLLYCPKDVGARTFGPSATQAQLDDTLDDAFRMIRAHGFDPVTDDNIGPSGFADPNPAARQLARLDGSIYAGGAYRGAKAHTFDIVGIYNNLLVWEGMAGAADDAAKTTVVGTRLAARNSTLSTAGLTIETGGYTIDESTVEIAQQRALWYDEATTSVKPMATFSTTNGYLIEFALPELPALAGQGGGQGTAITWAVGAGHVVPKQSKDVWQAARDSGYRVGWYNGQLGARASMMMEENWSNQVVSFIFDAMDGNNIWFGWNSFYHYAFEVTDVSGKPDAGWTPTDGPNPGLVDPKRQNPNAYDHTFGNRSTLTEDPLGINRSAGQRGSSHDGWMMTPKRDHYYSSDPNIPGTDGFFPMSKMKAYRRGIALENLIAAARTANQSATDALLTGLAVKTPFDVGAGDTGNAAVFNDLSRSYIGAGLPDARVHMEDIEPDDIVQLERDLYTILEA